MNWRVEQATGPEGATAEVATLTHEGREFTAMGAVVDTANGYLGGYVREGAGRLLSLRTFEGAEICPLTLTAEYYLWPRGAYGRVKMRCYRTTYKGRVYTGRHGDMDLLRMRARKAAP